MVWKLLYRKCTLNHLDTGKFPVQPLSRLNRYLQVSWSPAVCLLMCIYTCPVTFYPFLPLNDRRGWKAMAGIITSQNTRGPPSSATATRDYRHTVYKQVDRSCVAHCRHREGERNRKDGKEKGNETEGKRTRNKAPRARPEFTSPPHHTQTHTLDICVSVAQIMFAWTWDDYGKSKVGPVWWTVHWLAPPPSFFLTPQRSGTYLLLAMNSTNGFNH